MGCNVGKRSFIAKREIRAAVWKKGGGECEYCGCELNPFENFSIDHVEPLSRGGTDDLSNLVACCSKCNSMKQDRSPEQWISPLQRAKREQEKMEWHAQYLERILREKEEESERWRAYAEQQREKRLKEAEKGMIMDSKLAAMGTNKDRMAIIKSSFMKAFGDVLRDKYFVAD